MLKNSLMLLWKPLSGLHPGTRLALWVKVVSRPKLVVGEDRVRESFLERRDTRDLPSANRQISRPVHVPAETFASTHRQLIDDTGHETVVDIKVGTAVVESLIMFVHVSRERVGRADASGRGFVVQTLSPCVNRNERDGARPAFKLHIACVIARISIPLAVQESIGRGDIRERPPGSRRAIASRGIAARAWVAQRRIGRWKTLADVRAVQQVGSLVADVVHFQSRVPGQFALN